MAGRGWRAEVVRWWHAPSTLEVLTGEVDYVRSAVSAFTRFALLGLGVALPSIVFTAETPRPGQMVLALVIGVPWALVAVWLSREAFARRWLLYASVTLAAGGVGWWVGLSVEEVPASAVVAPVCVALITLWLPRRWAVISTATGIGAYFVTALARDVPTPFSIWVPVAVLSFMILLQLSWVLDKVRALGEQERAAQAEVQRLATAERDARMELAELNLLLEERVESQVGEIESLGRLRQFLSPAVADAVVADSLAPHRRRIAVVFCDLRGFTSFSSTAEPEELLDVLDAYYGVVGAELRTYGATVGSFQGDGILAYFNDPVPCDDPAGTAVAMALALRDGLDRLAERWSRRGFALGWGIGIAYGYATLGTIGFEDRRDYTPLGSVVNLASRLGDEAAAGEILLDGRTHHEVDGKVATEQLTVELKGFDVPIVAYRA